MKSFPLSSLALGLILVCSVKCDDTAGATASANTAAAGPPGPAGGIPAPAPAAAPPLNLAGLAGLLPGLAGLGGAVPPPVPGIGGLAGILPGLGGLGFNKHLDINAGAGFGPFLGGLGLGGVPPPPPPVDGAAGPGAFGGFPSGPFGLFGPSYIPSTWIGSALGAKGDLLFPLVIFVFFVVGVWTIIQFLLGLIVPLIAAKVSKLKGGMDKKFRRALTPQEEKDEQINHLTDVVMAAFENFGCMKTSACYAGNMVHSLAGADKAKQYEGILETMKIMDKDIVGIFKTACETGKEDCSKYPCDAFGSRKQVPNNV